MKEINKGQQVETGRCSKLREWIVHYEVDTWVAIVNLDRIKLGKIRIYQPTRVKEVS